MTTPTAESASLATKSADSPWHIELTDQVPEADLGAVGNRLVDIFSYYQPFSTQRTHLAWIRVQYEGQLLALVPTVRLVKRPVTDMLRHGWRRWLGPTLGPLAKKTTLLIDTAFMVFADQSPFVLAEGIEIDPNRLKREVVEFAKGLKGVDMLWITEPEEDCQWAAGEGFHQFYTLPMAHIEIGESTSFQEYAATVSRNRRRNFKIERKTFEEAGGQIDMQEAPLQEPLLGEVLKCLEGSAAHSQFVVPYNEVLIDPRAFAGQRQTVLVARVAGQVVGFMSFLIDGKRLMQCHGGLDYERSHEVLAYHNLIQTAIKYAIERGLTTFSMGPLSNETKRRATTTLKPMVANLWNRNPLDAMAAKMFFTKNLEVYRGELKS